VSDSITFRGSSHQLRRRCRGRPGSGPSDSGRSSRSAAI